MPLWNDLRVPYVVVMSSARQKRRLAARVRGVGRWGRGEGGFTEPWKQWL